MPRRPRGERRPADVIGNAVHVMKIATGELEDNPRDTALDYARQGGIEGGKSSLREAQQEVARRDRMTGGKSSLGKG